MINLKGFFRWNKNNLFTFYCFNKLGVAYGRELEQVPQLKKVINLLSYQKTNKKKVIYKRFVEV